MKLKKTKFKDLVIYEKNTYKDKRGYFRELYLQKHFNNKFPFDVMSYSKKNVVRGLHLQLKNSQAKLITVLRGKIFDVCLDCRKNSKTFGKHFTTIISENNSKSIFIPKGFAHGFCTLEKENYIIYSNSNYRHKRSELGIKYNDKELKIKWPIKKPIISKKDSKNMSFSEFKQRFYK